MKRFLIPIVSTIILSTLLGFLFMQVDLTPLLASEQAESVDALLKGLFVLAAVVFSLVVSFMGYSIVAFRRRPGDLTDAKPIFGNVPLEIVWTAIPLITVLVLGGIGTKVLLDITRPAEEELVVEVVGFQWGWSFSYPEFGFNSSELVLAIDRPTLFLIRSSDVIHSFWIPEFGVKIDAIPGIVNELRITPTETGSYTAYCSELCGTSHAYMTARTRVVEEAEFAAWVEASQNRATSAEEFAQQQGCLGCHSIDGSEGIGPTFLGLYNSPRTFQDGTTAIADEAYIRNSILNPGDQIVQGFRNQMRQDYAVYLNEDQVQLLVDYIIRLK